MLARTCEPGCRKKKRIVNILKISLDGQDPVFFERFRKHMMAITQDR
jgi:hypothetical protein